jgi:hypothetical protein
MNFKFLVVFTVFYLYAFFRYHIGKEIPFEEFYFVLNKAIAWFSFTLLFFTLLPKTWFQNKNISRKKIGSVGYLFSVLHLVNFFILVSEKRFPILYTEFEISKFGFFIIILAILSLLCFTVAFLTSMGVIKKQFYLKFGFIGAVVIFLHPLLIGMKNWCSIQDWPYFLPPITLLAFIYACFILMFRKKKANL